MDGGIHQLLVKLSTILDYFTIDPQKSILPIQHKSRVLFVYHVLESPRVSEFRNPRVEMNKVNMI